VNGPIVGFEGKQRRTRRSAPDYGRNLDGVIGGGKVGGSFKNGCLPSFGVSNREKRPKVGNTSPERKVVAENFEERKNRSLSKNLPPAQSAHLLKLKGGKRGRESESEVSKVPREKKRRL